MSNMILRERRNAMIGVLFYIFFVLLAVLGYSVLENATGIFQEIGVFFNLLNCSNVSGWRCGNFYH